MKPKSIVFDIMADVGGNCELCQAGLTYVDPKSSVTLMGYGVPELVERMAKASSEVFAWNMFNILEDLCHWEQKSLNNSFP